MALLLALSVPALVQTTAQRGRDALQNPWIATCGLDIDLGGVEGTSP